MAAPLFPLAKKGVATEGHPTYLPVVASHGATLRDNPGSRSTATTTTVMAVAVDGPIVYASPTREENAIAPDTVDTVAAVWSATIDPAIARVMAINEFAALVAAVTVISPALAVSTSVSLAIALR